MNSINSINREWQSFLERNDENVGRLIKMYYEDIAIKHQLYGSLTGGRCFRYYDYVLTK